MTMNRSWQRLLRSPYRRDPVVSLIVTMGIVDAVMGGASDRWSLMSMGLGMAGAAIVWRWWRSQQRHVELPSRAPIHYLPERSSRPALPALNLPRKHLPK
jgi:hypothetical protein